MQIKIICQFISVRKGSCGVSVGLSRLCKGFLVFHRFFFQPFYVWENRPLEELE